MRLIVYLDLDGLEKVDLIADPAEQHEAHQLWAAVQRDIEVLGEAVKKAGAEGAGDNDN